MRHFTCFFVLLFTALIVQVAAAQNYDDVYYSPGAEPEAGYSEDHYDSPSTGDAAPRYGSTAYQDSLEYSQRHADEYGNTYVTNNYYYDDHHDYYDTAYQPYHGFGYWDGCYVDRYWYDYNPYYAGVTIYMGVSAWGHSSWWRPRWRVSYTWCDPWYDPWYYGHCGTGWGYAPNYHHGYYHGYSHGYYNGYWDGYHDGYYGHYPSTTYYGGYSGGSGSGYYYGPRRMANPENSDYKEEYKTGYATKSGQQTPQDEGYGTVKHNGPPVTPVNRSEYTGIAEAKDASTEQPQSGKTSLPENRAISKSANTPAVKQEQPAGMDKNTKATSKQAPHAAEPENAKAPAATPEGTMEKDREVKAAGSPNPSRKTPEGYNADINRQRYDNKQPDGSHKPATKSDYSNTPSRSAEERSKSYSSPSARERNVQRHHYPSYSRQQYERQAQPKTQTPQPQDRTRFSQPAPRQSSPPKSRSYSPPQQQHRSAPSPSQRPSYTPRKPRKIEQPKRQQFNRSKSSNPQTRHAEPNRSRSYGSPSGHSSSFSEKRSYSRPSGNSYSRPDRSTIKRSPAPAQRNVQKRTFDKSGNTSRSPF